MKRIWIVCLLGIGQATAARNASISVASTFLPAGWFRDDPNSPSQAEPSLCPQLKGAGWVPVNSSLTFGCAPGYVCDPLKPDGCDLWPGPPMNDFACETKRCIAAPRFQATHWPDGQICSYLQPSGYFYLNPETFGLTYDIFDARLEQPLRKDTLERSCYTPPSQAVNRRGPVGRQLQATPAVCFDDCNAAYLIAQSTGKTPGLCRSRSTFLDAYEVCGQCIHDNAGPTNTTVRSHVQPAFAQYLDFCRKARIMTTNIPAVQSPMHTAISVIRNQTILTSHTIPRTSSFEDTEGSPPHRHTKSLTVATYTATPSRAPPSSTSMVTSTGPAIKLRAAKWWCLLAACICYTLQ